MKLFKICYLLGMVRFGMSLTAHDRDLMQSELEQMIEQVEEMTEIAKRNKEIIAQGERRNAMLMDAFTNLVRGILEKNDN